MSEILVKVDKVGKKFCRSLKRSLWYGVRDVGSELLGRRNGHGHLRKDEFWALRDTSLELKRGETLGIIGHNGAGKTTLLRILNGLIKPDAGSVEICGKMQALIALGAGFNPVLTGRENVYVNAAVLGMSKPEIDQGFDEIVEFSGIAEFIDMPVQSYSSGMAVRLGFAVAAHMRPDILLVDEVLAVGDLPFRTKCQMRIQELMRSGSAIVLVSHNLHMVSHICGRAITLQKGQIIFDGDPDRAIDTYRDSLIDDNPGPKEALRAGTGEIRICRVEVLDDTGILRDVFNVGEFVKIRLHYQAHEQVENPAFNIALHLFDGQQVTGVRTDVDGLRLGTIAGEGFLDILIPELNLLPNVYRLDTVVFHQDGVTYYDRLNDIASLKVRGGLRINGTAYLPHSWEVPKSSAPGVFAAQVI